MNRRYIDPFLTPKDKRLYKKVQTYKHRILDEELDMYYNKHPIIFSMTTSPIRLRKIGATLSLLLAFPYLKEIHINLPKKYRNKDAYDEDDIQFISRMSDKIKIKCVQKDIGPLTKIVPTLKRVRSKKTLVISVDDDIAYPQSLFYELLYYAYYYPDSIFTGSGFGLHIKKILNIKTNHWHHVDSDEIDGTNQIEIVEGWGAIAYRKDMLSLPYVLRLNAISTTCKLSDDLTISYTLARDGYPRYLIDNKYFHVDKHLKSFSYGLDVDALSKGSGTGSVMKDANLKKYMGCIKDIHAK
jgi:hypothetical protein